MAAQPELSHRVRLDGKVAIVTGAASGIGKATAFHLARAGAAVMIDYAGREDDAQKEVRELENKGLKASAIRADVSNAQDVQRLVQGTLDRYGALDILVNNAGIEEEHPFLEMPLEVWSKVIAVDLTGPWLCSQAAARAMVKAGAIETPLDETVVHDDEKLQKLLAEIPLRRMGRPDEIAEPVVYLASPQAAYVTGSTFVIDGGMMRQSGSL